MARLHWICIFVSTIHSKATWHGYILSASPVVTHRRQVTFRTHVSKLHIKATWQCFLALLLSKVVSNVLSNATWHLYLAQVLSNATWHLHLAQVLSNATWHSYLAKVLSNRTWHLYLAKYLALLYLSIYLSSYTYLFRGPALVRQELAEPCVLRRIVRMDRAKL